MAEVEFDLGGHLVKPLEAIKYIGVMLGPKLNLRAHLDYIKKKCASRIPKL